MQRKYNSLDIPVIIPSYEPDLSLLNLCDRLFNLGFRRVIVIDDGSDEEYKPIFENIESIYGFKILHHAINLGKGRALKDAFNFVLYQYPDVIGVITADSDGQHTPEDIRNCANNLINHPENLILGCRVFDGDHIPWKSKMGNSLTKVIFRYLCGIKLSDTQTGLRGIPRSLMYQCLIIKGERFDYETNVLLNANESYDFIEVPITTVYESKSDHKTHFDPFRDSIMIYRLIFSYILNSFLSVLIDFTIFSFITKAGANLWVATALGRVGSMLTNFSINHKIVFKSKGRIVRRFLRYLALVIISGTASALMIFGLSKIFREKTIVLKIVVEGILFFFNYYVQRSYVFSNRKERL